MREIKFRGLRENGEWAYGDLVHSQKVTETGLTPCIMVDGYHVLEETVGQFIGYSDKNGTNVYEDDIISTLYGNAQVIWLKYSFMLKYLPNKAAARISNDSIYYAYSALFEDSEVVGNIHNKPIS